MALELVAAGVACYVLGAILPWARLGDELPSAAGFVGSGLLVVAAALALGGDRTAIALARSTPLGGFEFRTGPLPGIFLLILGLVGAGISVYTAGYAHHVGGPVRRAGLHALLNLSLAAMVMVIVAGNALTFLLGWEVMSILTYVLVTLQFEQPGRPQAAFLMLALSEIGFAAVAVAFALMGGFEPGHDFAAIAARHPAPGLLRDIAFVLFLFGFGAKAGMLPLQGWLPEAHPAAPSNGSALLSAVVVKMAIFGMVLTTITLLGPPNRWWGYLALAIGVVSAAYGVLFSLLASDLKRALAFSTIENLGFMVTMIGAALVFESAHLPALVGLAITVALLHALYHGLLKGTLFLGAGAVDVATGTRDMDRLGGLAKRLRWSSAMFFIGAMGLAAVPPLNGFQTEWLGLQTLIRAQLLSDRGSQVYLAAVGAILTLTFALAVTTFIRIYGGVFLGAPRTPAARDAKPTPLAMRIGIGIPALCAVAMALVPPLGVYAAAAAATDATGIGGIRDSVLPPIFIHPQLLAPVVTLGGTFLSQILPVNGLVIVPTKFDYAFISPTYIFLSLAALIGVTAGALRLMAPRATVTKGVWASAIGAYQPSMQYTATAFTNPFRFIFGQVYRSAREIEGEYHQAPYFARTVRYAHHVVEPVETYLYAPIVALFRNASRLVALAQSGNVSLYLLYLFIVFVIALLVK